MYYVGFSTSTIVASIILFQGFNTTSGATSASLIVGFIIIFLGVHLLNLSRKPEPPPLGNTGHLPLENGLMNPRMSMSGRLSIDSTWSQEGYHRNRSDSGSGFGLANTRFAAGHGRQNSLQRAQTAALINSFEEPMGLSELREEEGEDDDDQHADERTRLTSGEIERREIRANGGHKHTASLLSDDIPLNSGP
jgi:hypothetical protein